MRFVSQQRPFDCAPIAIFNAIRYINPFFSIKKLGNIRRRCETTNVGTLFSFLGDTIENYNDYFSCVGYNANRKCQGTLWDTIRHHCSKINRAAIVSWKHSGKDRDSVGHTFFVYDCDIEHICTANACQNNKINIGKAIKDYNIECVWVLFYNEDRQRAGYYEDLEK